MYNNKKEKRCNKCTKKHCKHRGNAYGKTKQYTSSEESSFSSSSSGGDFGDSYSKSQGSFESSSYDDSDFSSSFEEKKSFQSKSGKSSSQMTNNTNSSAMDTSNHLSQTADIKYSTVEYEAHRVVKPSEFFSSKTGELKNKGSITLSVEKGHLERIRGTNATDFSNLRPDQKGGRHDLIKSMKLIVVSNYPQTMVLSFPTISAIEGEFYRDNKTYVNYTIPAGTFSSNSKTRFEKVILDRDITNSSKEYANYYSGYNPDNMEHKIHYTSEYMILPMSNPTLLVFNTRYPKEAVLRPNAKQFKNTGECFIPIEKGKECLEIAKEKIGKKISLGNCNDKFKVVISAVMPYERKAAHEKGKDLFKGFGDVKHIIAANPNFTGLSHHPDSKLPMQEHFQNSTITFDVWVEFEYVRLDGKQI